MRQNHSYGVEVSEMNLPEMIPIRQRFPHESLPDVEGALEEALRALKLERTIAPGMAVGIPVGSRGIRHIDRLVRGLVRHVRSLGAEPVVVSAMGSHGGGTPEGQLAVLRSLGITEERIGAPVHATVEAMEIARTGDGLPVYFDAALVRCDRLLVMNRIKPHTSFHGPLESGLVKMLVVGCGKPVGARQFHSFGPLTLAERLQEFGRILLERLPVAGGIAILENGREETAAIVPVQAEEIMTAEPGLLQRAREMLPGLPVADLDLLVVDQMGKNFSGTGMDTNVIGRMGIRGVPDQGPRIQRIVVLDLSEGSHGNANGVGLADLVTRRLAEKIDFRATYLNTLTTTLIERAKLPIVLESDREAVEAALRTLGSPPSPRIIRIRNTLELESMLVSSAVLDLLRGSAHIEVTGPPEPWPFDAAGNLF